MSTQPEITEASDTATRILSWSRPVNLEELTLEISRACVAYAERVNVKAGVPINFCFCPRCGEQMNPNYDASATPTPTARAEKAEAELSKLREDEAKRFSVALADLMESRQKLEDELHRLREDVKPLLEYLQHGPVGQSKVRDFLEKHPELKEAG